MPSLHEPPITIAYVVMAIDVQFPVANEKRPTSADLFSLVNYLKSKRNKICSKLLEVYGYMGAITAAVNILPESRTYS